MPRAECVAGRRARQNAGSAAGLLERRLTMPAIELRERRAHMLGGPRDYDVVLHGKVVDGAYFNTRGYRTGLPMPNGSTLDPGEVSLTRLRREVAKLNQEWKRS
jgi:hypothetical protein